MSVLVSALLEVELVKLRDGDPAVAVRLQRRKEVESAPARRGDGFHRKTGLVQE